MPGRQVGSCGCGHDWALHDAWGCAAFLAAFEATRGQQRYCDCRQAVVESSPPSPAPRASEPVAEPAG